MTGILDDSLSCTDASLFLLWWLLDVLLDAVFDGVFVRDGGLRE